MTIGPIQRLDFDDFFAAVNSGHKPFSWQCELVDHVLNTGQWPDRISAPTGAGKSSVVEIHLFLNAMAAAGTGPRVPRRLFTVVNRRGLVDNQYHRAEKILSLMQAESSQGQKITILAVAAHWLGTLRENATIQPFRTSVLRGQLSTLDLPVDDPTVCTIIAATPDMWGSRLLFRGFGASRMARPREAAMVAMDAILVLDEAHLNRQLLVTARRVVELQGFDPGIGVPTLQVTETTATSASEGAEFVDIGVDPDNLVAERDFALANRMSAPKFLSLVPTPKWTGKPGNRQAIQIAVEHTLRLRVSEGEDQKSPTVGCIVNHVDTALRIARELEEKGLEVRLLVGRLRPWDLEQLHEEHPNMFTPVGDQNIDVIVATQTVEVGVDIDFASLVTELAPGASLAQRFGRVNRLGLRDTSEIVVLTPETRENIKSDPLPYFREDMLAAWDWLDTLVPWEHANPQVIHQNPTPLSRPERLLYQRVESVDLLGFAKTSRRFFDEDDLELWLRDSLEEDQPAGGIVVRKDLPADDNAAIELLNLLTPTDREVFPSQLRVMQSLLDQVVVSENERDGLERRAGKSREAIQRYRAFISTPDGIRLCEPGSQAKPGDVIIIDRGIRFTTKNVASDDPQDKVAPIEVHQAGITVQVHDDGLTVEEQDFFAEIADLNADEATDLWQELHPKESDSFLEKSNILVEQQRTRRLVPAWYLIRDPLLAPLDEVSRQEWTLNRNTVLLADHQRDVASRTSAYAENLGLGEKFIESVVLAAQHHDDGKADPRFQKILGQNNEGPLAKSRRRSKQQIRVEKSASGLPSGWRHEQLSALMLAAKLDELPESPDELALRIVGASHGHGRPDFPHVGEDLVSADHPNYALARELFTQGHWDGLIERTDKKYGVYNCAYLEYLERAADGQISSEGK